MLIFVVESIQKSRLCLLFISKKTKIMSKKLYKFSAFTLVEVIVSLVLFSFLSVSTISIYNNILDSRIDIKSKQVLIENSNKVVDLISLFADEYTIDYEEYFNRAQVGCSDESSFWNVENSSGHCSKFTAYWNQSNDWYAWKELDHRLYACTSDSIGLRSDSSQYPYIYTLTTWSGCTRQDKQSFWEYYWQFRDVHTGWINDDNDEFVAIGPTAIEDNSEIQELYLISKDNTQRLFFRRNCHWTSHLLLSGGVSQPLCSIQILKLRWFDAWTKHDFDNAGSDNFGRYDGVIDTWACDYAEWFVCWWDSVWWEYANFRLPENSEDGWVDLTDSSEISILDWNLEIYPKKSPWLSLAETGNLIPPFFILKLQSQLNVDTWQQKSSPVENSDLFLQQIFFMKKDMYENDVYNPCEQVIGREQLICPVDFSITCSGCTSSSLSNIIILPKYEDELDPPLSVDLDFTWGSGYGYDKIYLVWPSSDTQEKLIDDSGYYKESLSLGVDSFGSYKYYLRLKKEVEIPEFCKDRLPTHYVQDCTGDLVNFVNAELRDVPCGGRPDNSSGLNSYITQMCMDTNRSTGSACNVNNRDPASTGPVNWTWGSPDTTWACYYSCNFWYEYDLTSWCDPIFDCNRDLAPTYKLNINNNASSDNYYLEFLWNPLSVWINGYSIDSTYQYIPSFSELVEWPYVYELVLKDVLISSDPSFSTTTWLRSKEWNLWDFNLTDDNYKMNFTIYTGKYSYNLLCSVDPCIP